MGLCLAILHAELPHGSAPDEIRLIPAGPFRADDGRPDDAPCWELTAEDAELIIAETAQRGADRVIDYEHATLHAKTSGQPAPAAGWFRRLEWRPGSGLWATAVRWTSAAARHIAAGEYRYLSPVFTYEEGTGRIGSLLAAALTNDPGLQRLGDLAALVASLSVNPSQETPMSATLLAALVGVTGLAAGASENDVIAEVGGLKRQVAALQGDLAAARAATPDLAKFVPVSAVAALQAECAEARAKLAALQAETHKASVAQTIEAALNAGKLTPAMREWAEGLGQGNLAALQAYIAAAPEFVKPGQRQTAAGGIVPSVAGAGLDESALAVCSALGIKPEQFKLAAGSAA